MYAAPMLTASGDGTVVNWLPDPPIAAGATVTVTGSGNEAYDFTGSTGTLVIDHPDTFTGLIAGFTGTAPDAAHSDVIDLAGINYNSGSFTESYNSRTDVLAVSDGTNSASLTFVDFTGTFKFGSDGNGGTDVFDPPANSSTTPVAVGHDNFVFHSNPNGNAGAGDNGAHDHAAWAHSEEWSALAAATQEAETVDIAQPAESHWHHALHNATHLH
jgi:hypothetical protein